MRYTPLAVGKPILSITVLMFKLLLCAFCYGCATPPGKLTHSDYSWEEQLVSADYQVVYRRIVTGFRTCSDIGIAEGNIFTDTREALFDVYVNGFGGGRSDFVMGTIRLKSVGDSTNVIVGAHNVALTSLQATRRNQWLKFSAGDYSCL